MYYFIVNNSSRTGKGKELWEQIKKKLDAKKIRYEAEFTTLEHGAERIAEEICEKDKDIKNIIIVGGDGTADAVVNGICGYDKVILGIIPTGSGNDLARGMEISCESETAADRVINPKKVVRMDIGVAQSLDGAFSRKFAVSSGMGYDAEICYVADRSKLKKFLNKIGLGRLVYFIIGLKLIFSNKPAECTVTIDGVRKLHYKKMIFAANMNVVYEGGGMPMGPNADPNDGKITVCIVHDLSRLKHLFLMPTVIKGKHIRKKGIKEITAETIEIETDHPMIIHTDGEFAGRSSHMKFSCCPQKIRMIV